MHWPNKPAWFENDSIHKKYDQNYTQEVWSKLLSHDYSKKIRTTKKNEISTKLPWCKKSSSQDLECFAALSSKILLISSTAGGLGRPIWFHLFHPGRYFFYTRGVLVEIIIIRNTWIEIQALPHHLDELPALCLYVHVNYCIIGESNIWRSALKNLCNF